jgi:hypothetical protein
MKNIFDIYPQMEYYHDASITKKRFVPYAMMSSEKNYQNKCIKTCNRGFRVSSNNSEIFSVDQIAKYDSINIVVGGSTVFGVGASNNQNTIPSLLIEKTDSIWLNFGIRAGNSFSEYIHLINLLHMAKKIDKIIFLSGLNDLYLSFLYNNVSEFDPGFFPDYSKSSKVTLLKKIFDLFSFKRLKNNSNLLENKFLKTDRILENYKNKYKRNFQLISSLEKVYNCKVIFILQPFISWSNKILSENELKVFKELEKLQEGTDWSKIKDLIGQKYLYEKIDIFFQVLSNKYNIKYLDSNKIFSNIKSDCFVDSVHLNDNANKLLTELILNEKDN